MTTKITPAVIDLPALSTSLLPAQTGNSGKYLFTDGAGVLRWDSVNLSSYVTSSSLTTTLSSYVTSGSLTSTLGSYVTSSSLTTSLSSYVTSSSLTSTLGSYVTSSSLTSTLNNYLTSSTAASTYAPIANALPSQAGNNGRYLTTDGNVLSWAVVSGGTGAVPSRTTANATTASLANNASGNISIVGFKGYALYKITTTHAAWIRIYSSSSARTNDTSRLEGEDPLPGAGVIAEVIATGSQEILITPGTIGFNSENVPTTDIYLAVVNKSGSAAAITVTLSILQLEA
jgi:hypothetical protein